MSKEELKNLIKKLASALTAEQNLRIDYTKLVEESLNTIKPLKARVDTLEELQTKVLKVCALLRRQFNRAPYEGGLSDTEFLDQVIAPLERKIQTDREIQNG